MSDLPEDVLAEAMAEVDRANMGPGWSAQHRIIAEHVWQAAYAAGRDAACEDSKTEWGIRRIGFRSVRITSEQRVRYLLRNWVVPGEIVTRHISPWVPEGKR